MLPLCCQVVLLCEDLDSLLSSALHGGDQVLSSALSWRRPTLCEDVGAAAGSPTTSAYSASVRVWARHHGACRDKNGQFGTRLETFNITIGDCEAMCLAQVGTAPWRPLGYDYDCSGSDSQRSSGQYRGRSATGMTGHPGGLVISRGVGFGAAGAAPSLSQLHE